MVVGILNERDPPYAGGAPVDEAGPVYPEFTFVDGETYELYLFAYRCDLASMGLMDGPIDLEAQALPRPTASTRSTVVVGVSQSAWVEGVEAVPPVVFVAADAAEPTCPLP
jgi:hypothetical protein